MCNTDLTPDESELLEKYRTAKSGIAIAKNDDAPLLQVADFLKTAVSSLSLSAGQKEQARASFLQAITIDCLMFNLTDNPTAFLSTL